MPKNLKEKNNFIEITSFANPKIKLINKFLKDGSLRQESKIILIDGKREIEEAVKKGWRIKEFFYSPEIIKDKKDLELIDFFSNNSKINYQLPKKIFSKISYKKNPDGFLAILESHFLKWKDLKIKKDPLILILESVEKPGNLGAIIRTAYAAGVDLIILNDQKTDLYSPNVIRASTGFIFSMPIIISSVEETIEWCHNNNIKILATSLKAKKNHFEIDFKKGTGIVFGTEAFGLSKAWLNEKIDQVSIPMISGVDSLNVSVSVGVIVYEATRQRKYFKN
jgi:TrmH family RNA methyltransferase